MSANVDAAGVHVTAQDARNAAEAARETVWERPSFAKGLYLGDFDLSLIHPHPQSTPEDTQRGGSLLAYGGGICAHHRCRGD